MSQDLRNCKNLDQNQEWQFIQDMPTDKDLLGLALDPTHQDHQARNQVNNKAAKKVRLMSMNPVMDQVLENCKNPEQEDDQDILLDRLLQPLVITLAIQVCLQVGD